jgi:hypothetical protein
MAGGAEQRYRLCGARGHAVVLLGQATVPISLRTPGSSPAPKATLERGAPRNIQTKTENYMALLAPAQACYLAGPDV